VDYVIVTGPASPFQVAAIHDRATIPDLARKIERHVGTALNALNEADRTFGRATVVYWDHEDERSLIATPDGVEIDVGWEVDAPFDDHTTGIVTVTTPAGPTASTTHVGPLEDLHEAHRAVREWCKQHGHQRVGPNWEVYNPPREGQPPRTGIFYLLE
jgi:effector-binding domain-containing protein